ncbi:MAG: hypothetical protein QOG43_2385, partial [Actinomycetota bacterium]|nr:hypothetical protein [Actinomycetota bacterium]
MVERRGRDRRRPGWDHGRGCLPPIGRADAGRRGSGGRAVPGPGGGCHRKARREAVGGRRHRHRPDPAPPARAAEPRSDGAAPRSLAHRSRHSTPRHPLGRRAHVPLRTDGATGWPGGAAHRRRRTQVASGARRQDGDERQPWFADYRPPTPIPDAHSNPGRPLQSRTPKPGREEGSPGGEPTSKKFRRRPTLPGGLPPSTIGAGGLNFRVRHGNGCNSTAIATGNLLS